MGITSHAQRLLGDMVFVELPTPGTVVVAGDDCVELDIGPVIHCVEDAGLAKGRLRFVKAHRAADVFHAALVLVVVVALIESGCLRLFVALRALLLAQVLPNRADALGHCAVRHCAQGWNAGRIVEAVDHVEQVLGHGISPVERLQQTNRSASGWVMHPVSPAREAYRDIRLFRSSSPVR